MKNVLTIYHHDLLASAVNLSEYNKKKVTLGRAKMGTVLLKG